MVGSTGWIAWSAGAMVALYLLSGAIAVGSRVRFDRRRRIVQRAQAIVTDASDMSADERRQAAITHLMRAPRSLLWALGSDSSLPLSIQPVVSMALVSAVGTERLQHVAARGKAPRRLAALRTLALTSAPTAWSLIAEALSDPSEVVGGATVTLLGQIDHRIAAELLADALRVGRHPRSRVATALEGFPRGVPDVLMPLLWSSDAPVRYWAATLMRRYPSTQGLYERLETLTVDENPLVRKAALDTLAELGNPRGVGPAGRALGDAVFFVRAHATRTLGAIGGIKCASLVGRMMADRDWWVRSAAKQTLEAMGSDVAPSVIPFLVHPDLFARNGAAEVLQNTGVYERYLVEEATERVDRYRRDVLLLLADAGGRRMWNGQVTLLSAAMGSRTRGRPAYAARPIS